MITVFIVYYIRVMLVLLILNNVYCMYDFVDTVDLTVVFENFKGKNSDFIFYFVYSILDCW